MRLIADTVAFTVNEIPKWNPINVCSYHLQEAGATPVQEIAYALSTAIAVLDEVKARGQVADEDFPKVFGRISFFVNAGVRFIEEHAKLRAMGEMWEWIGRNRYGVTEPKFLRLRYGVQVNSLGLTESQPENNVPRIVLEALAVTLGRDARARAIQLPAWNEALGLPRPWDQQWSLRIQQILANETDLLEYPDIFEGSKVMDGLVAELVEGAKAEMKAVEEQGRRGRGGPLHEGPAGRVEPRADRQDRARRDHRRRPEQVHRDRGIAAHRRRGRRHPHPRSPRSSASGSPRSRSGSAERDQAAVDAALEELAEAARDESATSCRRRSRPPRRAPPPASGPGVLREVFGDYRAPTGVAEAAAGGAVNGDLLAGVRERVAEVSEEIGHPIRILVGKPGLDGHSNGAEQIAVRARDVGMEVIYQGIRLTPEQIAKSARRGGRRRGRALDPLRLPPRARAARGRAAARATAPTSPWWSAGSSRAADASRHARGRRRRRLHAQGLRDQPDHGRDRRAGGRAPPRRAAGLMNEPELNGDRSSWLRCYRCWATDLEVQLHYDAILRVDPETAASPPSASTRSRRPSSSACAACTTSRT